METIASLVTSLSISGVFWLCASLFWLLSLAAWAGLCLTSSRQAVGPAQTKSRYWLHGSRVSDIGQTVSRMRYATATLGLTSLTADTPSSEETLKRRSEDAPRETVRVPIQGAAAEQVIFK